MSLIQKIKQIPKVVMLGAAIGAGAAGCTSITPWQTVNTYEETTGKKREVVTEIEKPVIRERVLNISDVYIENGIYKNKITESATDSTYSVKLRKTLAERIAKTKEEKYEITDIRNPLFLGFMIGGTILGVAVSSDKDKLAGAGLGFLGGGTLGLLLGNSLTDTKKVIETRVQSGRKSEEVIGSTRESPELTMTFSAYRNIGKIIRFTLNKGSIMYITDKYGIISWTDDINESMTKEGLAEKLYNIPLVQDIKPSARKLLEQKLLDAITLGTEEFIIETKEEPSNSLEIVKNAEKRIQLENYHLTDDAIYNVVYNFVDEEINSNIRTLKFKLRDKLTHVPVDNSGFEFKSDAPSKESLAAKYFTGTLFDFATLSINDYLAGSPKADSCPSELELPVWAPSKLRYEVTNAGYHYETGDLNIKGNSEVILDMTDKGSKVRVQQAEEPPRK